MSPEPLSRSETACRPVLAALDPVAVPLDTRFERVCHAVAHEDVVEHDAIGARGAAVLARPIHDAALNVDMPLVGDAGGSAEAGPIRAEIAQAVGGRGDREQRNRQQC